MVTSIHTQVTFGFHWFSKALCAKRQFIDKKKTPNTSSCEGKFMCNRKIARKIKWILISES